MNWSPSDVQLRSFARLWWPVFVLAVTVWLYPWGGWAIPTLVAAGVLVVAALVSRAVARVLFLGLQVITFPMAMVTSTIVLGAVYYLVVTPIGLALRLAGRDALGAKKRTAASLWVPIQDDRDPERVFRQY